MALSRVNAVVVGSGAGGGVVFGQLAEAGLSVTDVFRWIFMAAALGLALSLLSFSMMEERPLRGRVT